MVEQSSIYTHKPFLENTDSKPDDDTEYKYIVSSEKNDLVLMFKTKKEKDFFS